MGLLDFLFRKKKAGTPQEEFRITDNTVERGNITAIRINVTSGNYDSIYNNFIAFDTETTGLTPDEDIIIEVGAVKFIDGNIHDSYGSLINEGVPVPKSAYEVNHISTEMLSKYGKSPDIVYRELTDYFGDVLDGKHYLCAHNASFDIAFLKNSLERYGYSGTLFYIDTLSLSRKLIKGLPDYKQNTLADYFQLYNRGSHRAVTDAETCGNIFLRLLDLIKTDLLNEVARSEKCKPTEEEKEVFAIIAKTMKENGCNIQTLRTYRNSSNYVNVLDVYNIFKYKISKKKSYVIVPKKYADRLTNCEDCTNSEGKEYIRLIFDDPFELVQYGYVFSELYSCLKETQGMYINQYETQFLAQANLTGLTENEIERCIENAKRRQKEKENLREQEIKMREEQNAIVEAKKAEKVKRSQELEEKRAKAEIAKAERHEVIKKMLEEAGSFSKEEIIVIAELSAIQGKRAVIQMDDEGRILRIYESLSDASKAVGIAPKTIRDVANGKYKHAGGFCWQYADKIIINL